MKHSYQIWTLTVVFLIAGGYQNSFADGKRPNIVILATGGTIAGASATKNDVAKLAFAYGHGIENYTNDAPFDLGIANNPPNSKVPIKGVALPVLGVVAFLDHTWSEHFTSSAGYSLAIAALSVAYADVIEHDHKVLTKAVSDGRLKVFIERG